MGTNSPSRRLKPRYILQRALIVGAGIALATGLAGCKNAGGTGSASPIGFPTGSAAGPSATPGAASATGTSGLFTGTSTAAAAAERDPLLGLSASAPPPKTGMTVANPYAPYGSGTQPVPGLPNPSGSASPAALTGGSNQGLDGTNRGNPYPINPNGANQPATAPPIRMDQQGGTSGFAPVPGQPGGLQPTSMNSGQDEFRQLQNEMTRRKVVYQRLEMTSENNWRCIATVPDPANPAARRNFDVRASTDLGALRLAIQEMDKQIPAPAGVLAVGVPVPANPGGVVPATYGAVPLPASGPIR